MIDKVEKMCVFGAKTSLILKHTKEEALSFLKESMLKIDEIKIIEEQFLIIAKNAIDKVYQLTDEKVKAEFNTASVFMENYENSAGQDVDDKGNDEADRAALAALAVLMKTE